MKTYEFTIIASGLDLEADDFETRFFEAGCDDATVGSQNGRILIDFSREAPSLTEAIVTAVESALQGGAIVERVEPDPLVSLSDMASRSGMTKGAMSNYSNGHRLDGFPAPTARVTTPSPLWNWAQVAKWLYRNGRISRDKALEAGVFAAANDILKSDGDTLADALERRTEELEAALD
ncbi:MAG TPA: hypothetical protein VFH89_01225 [Sphingomicrobium sp.]|nr:hypothetical protein [Sphingomicrobium sp.]